MQQAYTMTSAGPGDPVLDAGEGMEFENVNLKLNNGTAETQVIAELGQDGTEFKQVTHAHGGEWAQAGTDDRGRYLRVTLVDLGTGVESVSAVVTGTAVPAYD